MAACSDASPNRGGRPSRMAVALRGLQPLRRLGVLDGELQALAEADVAGSTTCAAVALELVARRLDLERLERPVAAAGAAP